MRQLCVRACSVGLWKDDIIAQISNGLPIIDFLDCNLLSYTEEHCKGRVSKGLLSKERKGIPLCFVCLKKKVVGLCVEELAKTYILSWWIT